MSADEDEGPGLPRRKRRSWTLEGKRRIVDESLEDGPSIAQVARRHDVELAGPRELAPILPVTIAPEGGLVEGTGTGATGQMEIVLAQGDRIIVWADVETGALTRLLEALARR